MTDTEKKALALVNEVLAEANRVPATYLRRGNTALEEALCRAIEQHEAHKREVSDAVEKTANEVYASSSLIVRSQMKRFILPKPVDPLVEALREDFPYMGTEAADRIRAALAARGLEVRKLEGDA